MPDNILEVLLEKIINNWRKVYGAILGWAPWLMLVTPALCGAEVGGSPGQEIEIILANMVTPHLD